MGAWEVEIPPNEYLKTIKAVKEHSSYVCPGLIKFNKSDTECSTWIIQYTGVNAVSKKQFSVDFGYERFLETGLFFQVEVANPDFTQPFYASSCR